MIVIKFEYNYKINKKVWMIKKGNEMKINKVMHEKDKESRNNVRYSVQMIKISLYTLSFINKI